jgi:hypothetical protein
LESRLRQGPLHADVRSVEVQEAVVVSRDFYIRQNHILPGMNVNKRLIHVHARSYTA